MLTLLIILLQTECKNLYLIFHNFLYFILKRNYEFSWCMGVAGPTNFLIIYFYSIFLNRIDAISILL